MSKRGFLTFFDVFFEELKQKSYILRFNLTFPLDFVTLTLSQGDKYCVI